MLGKLELTDAEKKVLVMDDLDVTMAHLSRRLCVKSINSKGVVCLLHFTLRYYSIASVQ